MALIVALCLLIASNAFAQAGTRPMSGGASSGAAWGDITGALANQADLDTALGAKAASVHSHAISDVTSLQASLDAKSPTASTCDATTEKLRWTGTVWECITDQTSQGGSGAPADATYITQTSNATLSAEQALSALSTGIVKVTTTTGVLSTAVAGDFPTLNQNTTGTAAALTNNPSDCTANQFANAIAANGNLTCAALADTDVPNDITLTNLTQITTRAIADTTGTLAVARGGTNLTASTDDNVMVGNGTTWETKALPDCDADTTVLHYDTATNAFSCGDDDTGAGGSGPTIKRKTASQASTSTTFADVTDLTFAVNAEDYAIECLGAYRSAVTTTAIQLSFNGPTTSAMDYNVLLSMGATTSHGSSQAAYDAVVNPGTGPGTVDVPFRVTGTFVFTASGTLALRVRTEVSGSSVTIQRGAWCELHAIA